MTGLAQYARDAELPELGDGSSYAFPTPQHEPGRNPRRPSATGGWRVVGWLAGGVAGGLAIAWFVFLGPGETGSKAEWFFGAAVLCAVMVSMWQIVSIQRLARRDAAEAEERHRTELAAAEERASRELEMTQRLHRTQMEAQQRMHDSEMAAQREVARLQRSHLSNQLQKQTMIEVSRAVGEHTRMLATLWNKGASVLLIEDRDEREQAMNPIFEQIGQVVNEFSVVLGNAHSLVEDDRLHDALNRVNEAALMAIRVAEDVHLAVVEGRTPEPNPVPPVQRLMHTHAADARRLAWDLIRTGLDEGR